MADKRKNAASIIQSLNKKKKRKRRRRCGVDWPICILSAVAVLVLAAGVFTLVRFFSRPADKANAVRAQVKSFAPAPPTPGHGCPVDEQGYYDFSEGSILLSFPERFINQPSVCGDEILFSAGTGSPDTPMLQTLYLYHYKTGALSVVAKAQVEYGEIYEPVFNRRWIAWLDTDHGGTNVIYLLDRRDAENGPVKVKTCKNGKPKLRLWGDTLIWIEQASETQDKLYLFDIATGEDLPLTELNDAATYGVSAPSIHDNIVVWAAPETTGDPEKSVINIFNLEDESGGGEIIYNVYHPGMYVHEPLAFGNVLCWINKNKAPDSALYLSVDRGEPVLVANCVTTYSLGDGFLVYGQRENLWVYFWQTKEYARVTNENQRGILPQASEDLIVWFDISQDRENDMLSLKKLTREDPLAALAQPPETQIVDFAQADGATDPAAAPGAGEGEE